eukprot:3140361-Rhodomonas_salina.1
MPAPMLRARPPVPMSKVAAAELEGHHDCRLVGFDRRICVTVQCEESDWLVDDRELDREERARREEAC